MNESESLSLPHFMLVIRVTLLLPPSSLVATAINFSLDLNQTARCIVDEVSLISSLMSTEWKREREAGPYTNTYSMKRVWHDMNSRHDFSHIMMRGRENEKRREKESETLLDLILLLSSDDDDDADDALVVSSVLCVWVYFISLKISPFFLTGK